MNDYDTLEKVEEYFKKVNCYGEKYNYCFGCGTIQNMYFGVLGVLISNKINKNIMGYLLNKNEKGICLIPIVIDTFTKNKIEIDNYIFIPDNDIDKVVIKNEDISFKRIKIILKDKTKYILKTPKKIKNVDYHTDNLNKFMGIYK